jgi:TolB protein
VLDEIPSRSSRGPTFERILVDYRTLKPSQRAQLWVGGPDLAQPELLLESTEVLFEAPNWSRDGEVLFLNGAGQLWRVDLRRPKAELAAMSFPDLPPINNDHVLDPDGHHIYMSAMDGHIYRGALDGGDVERVTIDNGVWHFLHGVSPDGSRLAYVRLAELSDAGRLAVMRTCDTSIVLDTGSGHLDGPEWSPDGAWIYFNTESFTQTPGHAQLGRIPDGGGGMERVVESSSVDWFPHLSPNGRFATYIAFPAGTTGHPPDLDVEVRVVATTDWSTTRQSYQLFGGQGTINVNSWCPDSSRFALVAYPMAAS